MKYDSNFVDKCNSPIVLNGYLRGFLEGCVKNNSVTERDKDEILNCHDKIVSIISAKQKGGD